MNGRVALAVDGGNSKTDLALVSADGELLALRRGPASSPHHLGLEQSLDVIEELVVQAAGASRGAAEVADLFLAGVDFPVEEREAEQAAAARGWAGRVTVRNDTFAVLRAGTERGWGVAVTCGAGINCVGVAPDGRTARFPALGELTGDWGGGRDVGFAALAAAARSEDGRGPKTSLERLVPAHFGVGTPLELAESIHRRRISTGRVVELAPVVLAEADIDPVAGEIVDRLAAEVVALARAAIERLEMTREPVEVLLGGGVLQAGDGRLLASIEDGLRAVGPGIAARRTSSSPIVGAALSAIDELGAGPEAQARLRRELDTEAAKLGGAMSDVRFEEATRIYPGTDAPAVDRLDLHIEDREFMVLVGPSGSGKTTALRMLAGLEEVDSGGIWIGDRDVTYVPPKDHDVAMVFQNYALYPYLTVANNIAFPLKMAGVKKRLREEKVRDVARMLGLEEYLQRKPAQLSGGQRQRVAMGRAIIRHPSVFLMDEPLSNLDAKLRVQMRADIASLQAQLGVTSVYVTHDQSEAMTLGHRVALLKDGRLQQCAAPRVLYEQPANLFVAGFIGSPAMSMCTLAVTNGSVELGGAHVPVDANGRPAVVVGLRPESLELASEGVPAEVEVVEEFGADAYVFCVAQLGGEDTKLVARVEARRAPRQGERVKLNPKADEAHVFDPETGVRL